MMALVQTDRLPVRQTWVDRTALAAAQRIETLVAWRMCRRSERLARYVTTRDAHLAALAAHDAAVAAAHSSGMLPR